MYMYMYMCIYIYIYMCIHAQPRAAQKIAAEVSVGVVD